MAKKNEPFDVTAEVEKLKTLVNELDADVAKAAKGTKAAITRVRKGMQAIKSQAQAVRVGVMTIKDAA